MSDQQTSSNPDLEDSIPFYPEHVRSEFRVAAALIFLVLIVGIIGFLLPVGLNDPADPLDTPAHVKPEWYFLSFYQILKFIPKTWGGVGLVLLPLIILLWPFLDHKPDRSSQNTRIRLAAAAIGFAIIIALTIWGEVS